MKAFFKTMLVSSLVAFTFGTATVNAQATVASQVQVPVASVKPFEQPAQAMTGFLVGQFYNWGNLYCTYQVGMNRYNVRMPFGVMMCPLQLDF